MLWLLRFVPQEQKDIYYPKCRQITAPKPGIALPQPTVSLTVFNHSLHARIHHKMHAHCTLSRLKKCKHKYVTKIQHKKYERTGICVLTHYQVLTRTRNLTRPILKYGMCYQQRHTVLLKEKKNCFILLKPGVSIRMLNQSF